MMGLLQMLSHILVHFLFPCLSSLWYFRCGQRWECQRGSVQGQWLWSFNQMQQCLSIQYLSLYNISHGEKTDVMQGEEWGTDGSNTQ